MKRIIFKKNPVNEKDQIRIKNGIRVMVEEFTYIDFIPGTRKNRKMSYLISSFGRIIDIAKGTEIKYTRINKGNGNIYDKVLLYLENEGYKKYDINMLVAEAFVPDPNRERYERNIVAYLDNSKENHTYCNLRWISSVERYVANRVKNGTEYDKCQCIKCLLKRGYSEIDIKELFKSRLIGINVTLKLIRSIKKEFGL